MILACLLQHVGINLKGTYRVGILIVVATLVGSTMLCAVAPTAAKPRAATDLSENPFALESFRFENEAGKRVTQDDLTRNVWIAAFIFTRCPLSCPKISSKLAELQPRLAGSGVKIVSISVDPEFDTPKILADYARRFHADSARWMFLTGPQRETYDLIQNRFKLPVQPVPPGDRREGVEAVSHSARLALVDRGNKVIGVFESDDPDAIDSLVVRARQRDASWMPTLNAGLNATCGILLLLGWGAIRRRYYRGHAALMTLCVAASTLFLGCYLAYHYQVKGSVPFRGAGVIRLVYLSILLSHTILAIAVVPLVIIALRRAIGKRFVEHARITKVLFPIWLYVSITGVVVYWMLYQMPISASATPL